MRRWLPRLALILGLAAVLAAGPSAWGRLLLRADFPAAAARLIEAPRWRGVALYQAGDYAAADTAFLRAGRGATYNRGNALAMIGDYPLARSYYDAVLYLDAADADAIANRALVDARIAAIVGQGSGHLGKIGADSAPEAAATVGTFEMRIQALMRGRPKLARPGDTRQSVVADLDWLTSVPDDPGQYIKLRIASESSARADAGQTPPAQADQW